MSTVPVGSPHDQDLKSRHDVTGSPLLVDNSSHTAQLESRSAKLRALQGSGPEETKVARRAR